MIKPKKTDKESKFNYDKEYDLLYIKINNFDYHKSIDLGDIIIDFDEKKNITGIEVMDASEFFNVSKQTLKSVKKWLVKVSVEDNKLQLRIEFNIKENNKMYVKNPIIIESLREKVPDAELVCAVG